jgi:hypothetical protein
MDSRAAKAAKNQALFRDVNERVVEAAEGFEAEQCEAFCECSVVSCAKMIQITPHEYNSVRSRGDRFALIAGHDDPAVERVVEENERFVVVEKIGESAEVARELDPRAG